MKEMLYYLIHMKTMLSKFEHDPTLLEKLNEKLSHEYQETDMMA